VGDCEKGGVKGGRGCAVNARRGWIFDGTHWRVLDRRGKGLKGNGISSKQKEEGERRIRGSNYRLKQRERCILEREKTGKGLKSLKVRLS